MQCRSCGFLVPQNLKFAIMKNFCPQCGNKLFTDKEINYISTIQSRVLSQSFSGELTEQLVYDVALFIYNEITNGLGRVILDEEIKTMSKVKEQVVSDIENIEVEDEDIEIEDIEKVKEKIRAEEAARVASESRASMPVEDKDTKVARLKQIHQSHASRVKNPSIRRIDSE